MFWGKIWNIICCLNSYVGLHHAINFQCLHECIFPFTLQWRHNERGGVSNHRRLHCLLNCWFRRRSTKTSKLRVTGLCVGNSPVTVEFPTQKASNANHVSIWWRHHIATLSACKFHQFKFSIPCWRYDMEALSPLMLFRVCYPPTNNVVFCFSLALVSTIYRSNNHISYYAANCTMKWLIEHIKHNTVRCRYNAVKFFKNPHNRHPLARPWSQDMGCLLWF